jgi:SAM-dependent methyltransferase
MDIYSGFAGVYDKFMDLPYEAWADYVEQLWTGPVGAHNRRLCLEVRPHLVLDLACGTGSLIKILTKRGYDMIGIDASPEMLGVASQKNPGMLFLNQDMRRFELYGTVDAIVCLCDSINYILEYKELVQVFKQVTTYLNPGGSFIFDVNTEYKFKHILADNNFSHTEEDGAYIWENFYDPKTRLNEYQTTFFIKNKNGTYNRFEEFHVQKAHTADEIKKALKVAGLQLIGEYRELTTNPPTPTAERVFFAAVK